MRLHGPTLVLSATDLSNFLGCRHRTALDMAVANGVLARTFVEDPLLELLWKRGFEHEAQYVESLRMPGREVVDLREASNMIAATKTAMRSGADVIVQGALGDEHWFGRPDVMRRTATSSALGDWSYEIYDTKLARETRAGTVLQLGLYSELLGQAQDHRPEYFHVVTPDIATPVRSYRVDDYAAYFRLIRADMLNATGGDYDALAAAHYPEPVDHCEICEWSARCAGRRRADDHLSLVANITRAQRRELETHAVTTLTGLAAMAEPLTFKPKRGSADSYERVQAQARLQLDSRGVTPPLHELLSVEPGRGLCRLPAPSESDLFLDLEGDAFGADRDGGCEYLFGLAKADGSYDGAWAFTDADERRGFEWVMDTVTAAASRDPAMHVYHYAPYEAAAFKRLMGRYATRERELDTMLREGRFVDLYAVVRQGLRAGIERYSIKNLESLYGFTRVVQLRDADRALKVVQIALGTRTHETIPPAARDTVEGYNRDDCVSTLRLRDWLETLRARHVASGVEVPRPVPESGEAPAAVDEKARNVEALRARLLEGVPEERVDRTDETQGRWLLAYLLDYHRRESKSTWWEYFRLCDLDEDELLDQRAAVAGLALAERIETVKNKKTGKPTGTVVDRYRYPEQEMEIDVGGEVWLQDKRKFGDVVGVDRIGFTIDVKKTKDCTEVHPTAMFAFKHVRTDEAENSIARIAEAVIAGSTACAAARALLAAEPPRLASGAFTCAEGEGESAFAVRVVHDLHETTLPIQGPPGAGKTFTGARMICDLVRAGKKVGITATGHKVIRNLLEAVAREADRQAVSVRLGHKCDDDIDVDGENRVAVFNDNSAARDGLTSGAVNVVGGTTWLWSRHEFAGAVDVLFVDEAGQMALANVVAVAQAANSVVLLGDPQQLEQPRKGSHPDGVDASAFEHILKGHQTIAVDRGIFLPVTWRLAPSIAQFTSELFYDRRLTSRARLERQRIDGVDGAPAAGLALLAVDHDDNKNYSLEEIDAVAGLVERLTAKGASWTDADGHASALSGTDILVVAPYNAQVTRLVQRLAETGVRVGTVDKFQGQEAPVVIYSTATSRPEDAPRGMEFLYSLNRLNVATSRAKCLAILVASPHLFQPECRSPRQMQLANAFCRFREMAAVLT